MEEIEREMKRKKKILREEKENDTNLEKKKIININFLPITLIGVDKFK